MSAERDELKELVDQLPDERVPAVLAEARRQARLQPTSEWPPPWFGSFASGRHGLGRTTTTCSRTASGAPE